MIKNTNIQECYQRVLKFIQYVSMELEKDLTTYSFMNRIIENKMNFTYFQMTNKKWKEMGLKLQVIFIRKTCMFEVWLSDYNKKIQNDYYMDLYDYYMDLCKTKCPFEICSNPNKNDYLIRIPISLDITIDNYKKIIFEIKSNINKLENFFEV